MKLILAVVQDDDAGDLIERLVQNRFSTTKLASTGGFLKEGNTTLMVGVPEEQVDEPGDEGVRGLPAGELSSADVVLG